MILETIKIFKESSFGYLTYDNDDDGEVWKKKENSCNAYNCYDDSDDNEDVDVLIIDDDIDDDNDDGEGNEDGDGDKDDIYKIEEDGDPNKTLLRNASQRKYIGELGR